ncbi:Eco57I restriction-modification methylase domain-containing protein [Nocardia sp. NPDC003979]
MASFDSIVVGEDWISEHYFTTDSVKESFHGKVMELRKGWDAEAKEGRKTVRSSLLASAGELHTALGALAENPDSAPKAHAQVRAVFGFDGELTPFAAERAGSELLIPDAQLASAPNVLFLQANPVESIEDFLGTGTLIAEATEDGKPLESASKTVSAAFRSDTPPAFVVVQAGRWLLLAEAERWAEGRYLAMDLLVVVERRHEARGGEIDRAAAIFGHQSLRPDADGNIWWTGVLEDSVKHTVGVSKDLREGIRLSIEIIANEVVRRRHDRSLTMDGIDGNELAKHSLRFLYRILFLLYAEASPEMQVLPTGAAEYEEGYGLDRLRELTLTELVSHHARTGTHLYESLKRLFDLVDQGHKPAVRENVTDDPAPGLEFNPLRADLFSPKATALIDEVGLGNEATQQVLAHLLLTKESKSRKGADRGFISYAELGINQLGAVYEGLMSYTGFFAEEDLYEVAKDGNPEKGSWVVPVHRADHLSESDFVRAEDPTTGELKPVLHPKGTFVFRLAGRERQQSASYYTPEVLTKFVVSQALEELLDQNGHRTTPDEILSLTICEPALGSGAFAIEAVRQLAAEYLKRKQEDVGELIDADQYTIELQKVKAHIALHQVYGVDLNATAVELAEISLWLDTMVAGLQAPWFGLHLRRGNSLIGARRAVYAPSDLTKKAWLTTVPKDVPLGEGIGAGIHHFLLPAQGWGAIVDTAEAKTYAPEAREQLRLWRNEIRKSPSKPLAKRLAALAERVETLWNFTLRRLTIAESEIRRDLHLWRSDPVDHVPAVTREQIETVLNDENGSYQRLRRVMDAWCALWSWPVTTDIPAPDWDQWVGALEALLGNTPKAGKFERYGQTSFASDLDWTELDIAEDHDRVFAQAKSISVATNEFPWLTVASQISRAQGFHHWQLDFASVFERGGFSLQVGNPPWVQPDWNFEAVLAEYDPWWQLSNNTDNQIASIRLETAMNHSNISRMVLDVRAPQSGVSEFLKCPNLHPDLDGSDTNLYRSFVTHSWRISELNGVVGLIHPAAHFSDTHARRLRSESYRRLRRHWDFRNQLKLFPEIGNTRQYSVNVYSKRLMSPSFIQASFIFHPTTILRSLRHDGSGPAPTVKSNSDEWCIDPHLDRILHIDIESIRAWRDVLERPETPELESRMIYMVNSRSLSTLRKLVNAPRTALSDVLTATGWMEKSQVDNGLVRIDPLVPPSWHEVLLQGPNLSVANPISQQVNPSARNHRDYSKIDLTNINGEFIPRTKYQMNVVRENFLCEVPHWDNVPSTSYFRLIWRRRLDGNMERTLLSAIVPPGPFHFDQVMTAAFSNHRLLAITAGFWSSIPVDFLLKSAGFSDLRKGALATLLFTSNSHTLDSSLILRTLRLNCLLTSHGPLWESLYDPIWQLEEWVPRVGIKINDYPELGEVSKTWSSRTALRSDFARRQALIEIDAIVAVMLNITAEELLTIYRTQFPVLQKYEREALYDATGRQLPTKLASEYRNKKSLRPSDLTIDGTTYVEPFIAVSREREMKMAHDHFTKLTLEAMT